MDYAKEYGRLHQNPKYFAGQTLKKYTSHVNALVLETGAKRLLDYGSGKGYQYLAMRLHEKWGGSLPVCYDVGVRQLTTRPEGVFDGLICTDMLEHIEEKDVPAILDDMLGFLDKTKPTFAFFGISCVPAKKKYLSDGRNVHVCVKPGAWWDQQLRRALSYAGTQVYWKAVYEEHDDD